MEEEIRVLEDAVRVSSERKSRAEVMRFEKEIQVKAERWDANEELARMEE